MIPRFSLINLEHRLAVTEAFRPPKAKIPRRPLASSRQCLRRRSQASYPLSEVPSESVGVENDLTNHWRAHSCLAWGTVEATTGGGPAADVILLVVARGRAAVTL